MIVYGTKTDKFKEWYNNQTKGKSNGAYWYSKEIEDIILPEVGYDLFYVTAGAALYNAKEIPDGAVVVCHQNRSPKTSYHKLFGKDILWVCSKHSTVEIMKAYGENAVYIPLSIDTKYVEKFKRRKTKDIAYAGNAWSFKKNYLESLPDNIVQLSGLTRTELLKEMAKYKKVIAEGRCLMEAQVLGAEGEVPRYPNLESVFVEPLDSRDAIPYWKQALEGHIRAHKASNTLICVKDFNDLKTGKIRRPGDIFMVDDDRADVLLSHNLHLVDRLQKS